MDETRVWSVDGGAAFVLCTTPERAAELVREAGWSSQVQVEPADGMEYITVEVDCGCEGCFYVNLPAMAWAMLLRGQERILTVD